jgi:pyridoxamine 5'-phosphate oxidase
MISTVIDERDRPLCRSDLDPDPLRQFERWFADAAAAVRIPEAMALATADSAGAPSARMVLLKEADERGLVFFTHYPSRKGRELEANPKAALLFYWDTLGRQVRVEGLVERVAPADSDAYFATRPASARLGANASRQSAVLESRAELERRVAALEGSEAGRPEWWGGLRLRPESWEFWQHRASRLHDRFRYRRADGAWLIERLYP